MPATSDLHRRFCQSVRSRRLALNLTQAEVAERLGISQSAYTQIERGRSNPSLGVVERVAAALSCDAAELLTRRKIPA